MISIFGYVFSFGGSEFQIFEGETEKEKIKGYSAYTVKNVPREEALKGVTYWLSLMVENFMQMILLMNMQTRI